MDTRLHSLKTDKELLLMTPPLSNSDARMLRINLSDGMATDPICVWNTTIIDGYEKYEICTELGIPFEINEVPIRNRQEAIVWVSKKQLERADLTPEIRRFLIGKRYIAELKLSRAMRMKTPNRPNLEKSISRGAERVRTNLSKEFSVSIPQLNKYRQYASYIESLAEIVPEIYAKAIAGNIILSIKPTLRHAQLSGLEMQKLVPKILDKPSQLVKITREAQSVIRLPAEGTKAWQKQLLANAATVEMHDSNAEVMSLASTVPTWTKAIRRVLGSADIGSVSDKAITILINELSCLSSVIDVINKIIEEYKNVGS